MTYSNKKISHTKGFTLIELVVVIVLLGIMSVGVASFVNLSTQIYVNVADRDELIASARFAVERLNREIRNALPNSVRIGYVGTTQCIEFVPIKASTVYTDIPVSPEPLSNKLNVVKFQGVDGNLYQVPSSGPPDRVVVYPLDHPEVYDSDFDKAGKVFRLSTIDDAPPPPVGADEWTLTLSRNSGVQFDSDSPTKRLYIIQQSVSYCVLENTDDQTIELRRYVLDVKPTQLVPPTKGSNSLMANNLVKLNLGMAPADLPFVINEATLQRNANVQLKLHFQREGEDFVFNNEIHLVNVP